MVLHAGRIAEETCPLCLKQDDLILEKKKFRFQDQFCVMIFWTFDEKQ